MFRDQAVWDYSGPKYFDEVAVGKTVYYWTLVMGQIAAAISSTTKQQSVFGFFGQAYCFPNTTLNIMFVGEVVLGLLAIYVPIMQGWFNTASLTSTSILMPVLALCGICLIEEIRKLIFRKIYDDEDKDADDSASGSDMSGSESYSNDSASEHQGLV